MAMTLGDRIQFLRKEQGYNQKDFADYVEIPQPSLSAYENNKNIPSLDALIAIATKCNISLDWLCGLTERSDRFEIHELSDLASVLHQMVETNELGVEIKVNDHLPDDVETAEHRWYTQLTIYGNDKNYKYNGDLCRIVTMIQSLVQSREAYQVDEEMYELKKANTIAAYTSHPLTKKQFPKLTQDEWLARQLAYLKSYFKNTCNQDDD